VAVLSFLLGVLALVGTCVALIPLVNLLNCVALPTALFGLLFGVASLMRTPEGESHNKLAVAGVVLSSLALLVGGVRMLISLLSTGGLV